MALLVAAIATTADEPQAGPSGIGLKWGKDGKASAQFEKCPLEKVLQSLSEQGQWQIFIEPELRLQVTTRFKNLTHSQALRRLLSDVNFAIIPSPRPRPGCLFTKLHPKKRSFESSQPSAWPSVKKPGLSRVKSPTNSSSRSSRAQGIDIDALAAELGAKIVGKIDGLDIYRLRFKNEQQAGKAEALLEKNEGIASVDSNYGISRPDTLTPVGLAAPPLNLRPSSADDERNRDWPR